MKVEVLMSCMNQTDHSIISRSNIQSDAVVINQCSRNQIEIFSFINKLGQECNVKFISTTDKGLSRSRNLALENSTSDICIICDDDEIFEDNYVENIINAYKIHTKEDLLFFEIGNRSNGRTGYRKNITINRIKSLKICSVQITFKRASINRNNIRFNEDFGAGVSLAGGEEHIFMFDCFKRGLKARNIPIEIAQLILDSPSTWRGNFSPKFLIDEGRVLRMLFGPIIASFVGVAFLFKNNRYKKYRSEGLNPIKLILKGIYN